MSVDDYGDNPLWDILVESVHKMILYPHHKAYVRNVILRDRPEISFQDLAVSLRISLGEALVILFDLQKEKGE